MMFVKFFLTFIFIKLSLLGHSFSFSPSDSLTSSSLSVEEESEISLRENLVEETMLSTDSLMDNEQKSVWKIRGSVPFGSGTAFSIGSNLFVTNFHVMFEILENDNSITDIFLEQESHSSQLIIKRIVMVSAFYDLVLFETEENVTNFLNMAGNPPQSDDELFILGYPKGKFQKTVKTGKLVDRGHHYTFPVNGFFRSGISGSPVLNEEKRVVSIAFMGIANMGSVIKLSHLKDLIKGNVGLDCSDLINSEICMEKEWENLKKIADQGNVLAQCHLAMIYEQGVGTNRNVKLAFDWYEKSAIQGNAPAQFHLANMYYYGKGTIQDFKLAFFWVQKSAIQGNAPAQSLLANMYYHGEGATRDFKLAFYWMQEAVSQGYAPAQYGLAMMYRNGEETEENLELAFYWMQEAASQGYILAQYDLAMMYKRGEGTEKNPELALKWMQKSAEQGYFLAQYDLAMMYRDREGTEESLELALEWMQKSAEQGYSLAQKALEHLRNQMLSQGKSNTKNTKTISTY